MRRRLIFGLCLLGVVVLYGWRLGARAMWEPDEPRYSEIAREMIVSGNWIEPRLDFLKYYEKPPLTYWITAVSFRLFGLGETAARIGPVIAALVLLAGTWFLGRTLYDERTANIAALALALSPLTWVTGRLLLTDIFLAAGVVWAVAGYVMAAEGRRTRASIMGGMAIAGAAFAAAWLAKGPVGLVIPLLGIVPYRLLGGRDAGVGARGWLVAAGVFVLLGVPWFVAIGLRDPSFTEFFFFQEHVLRYFTPKSRRQQPWYFYLLVLLVGLFPGSVLVPWASSRIWPGLRPRSREDRGSCLLVSLGLLTVLLFTLSHSKLATYVLPVAPAFALLIGRSIRTVLWPNGDAARPVSGNVSVREAPRSEYTISPAVPERISGPAVTRCGRIPWGLRASLAVGAAMCLAGAAGTAWFARHPLPPLEPGLYLYSLAALLGLMGIAFAVCSWTGSRWALSRALMAIAGMAFVCLLCVADVLERLDPLHSVKPAALFVRARAGPDDLIASYGAVIHGLTFYAERRTAIIGGAGELTFGARRGAHEGWVMPRDQVPVLLARRKIFLVLPSRLEERAIRDSGGRLIVLFRTSAYSVLGNA